MQKMLSLLEYL